MIAPPRPARPLRARLTLLLTALALSSCDHRPPTAPVTVPQVGLTLERAPAFFHPRLELEPGSRQRYHLEWHVIAQGVDTTERNDESTFETESVIGTVLAPRGRYVVVETRDAWPRLLGRHRYRQDDRGWYELIEPSTPAATASLPPIWRSAIERSPRLAALASALPGLSVRPIESAAPYEITLLPLPLTPGTRWAGSPEGPVMNEAIGIEVLELPMGRFPAWHVRSTPPPLTETLYDTYRVDHWYGTLGLMQTTIHLEWTLPETWAHEELRVQADMRRVLTASERPAPSVSRD